MAGISVSSQFGNLYFLLLTQIRTAHIFHPASEPRINQNLPEYHETHTQAWEGWRMQRSKPLLLFSLLIPLSLCWLLSAETTVYWAVHFLPPFTYCPSTQLHHINIKPGTIISAEHNFHK